MSVITLRPSGDGTTTGWSVTGGTGSHASAIVDDPDANDGDTSYVLSPNALDGTMFVDLDDVPADFDPAAINSITIKVAHRRLNTPVMAVDLGTVNAFLTRADELTAISTTPTAVSSPIQAGYLLTSFTPSPTGTHTVAEWNGARLALVFDHTSSQTIDTVNQSRITAAEVVIDYTPAAPQVFDLDAQPGSYAVTGAVAGLVANFVLAAEVAAYALTGAVATFGVEQNNAPGSYSVSGAAGGFVASYVENAVPGSYALTGQAATFALEFPATAGVYSQTGVVADLEYTPLGPAEFPLDAQPGAYSLTGAPAGLVAAYLFPADPGSYSVTGVTAGLVAGYVVEAVPGVYLLTGTAAEFAFLAGGAFELDAAPGVYVVTGYADGAVIVEPVTGTARYRVTQGLVARTLIAKVGGRSRNV